MIHSAKRAGADIAKFQTYSTEKRFSKNKNEKIFNILKNCELSFNDFKILKKECDKIDIEFSSTAFDKESAVFLDDLGVEIIKIASFDVQNKKFLNFLSSFDKSFILSTGMSNENDIKKALSFFQKKKRKITLLHCISNYPNDEENSHLSCIESLKTFGVPVGLSDHTNGIYVPILASAMGATCIEKHFMINNDKKCIDHLVSITEKQFLEMKNSIDRVMTILGSSKLNLKNVEKNSLVFKRNS